ncbi:DUF4158 domain-containing protein [Nocardia sp. NPDC004750]
MTTGVSVLVEYLAEQLEIADLSCVKTYTRRDQTRLEHRWEISRADQLAVRVVQDEKPLQLLLRRRTTEAAVQRDLPIGQEVFLIQRHESSTYAEQSMITWVCPPARTGISLHYRCFLQDHASMS